MTESIKEIAKQFKVTPQRIYQVISTFKDTDKPRRNGNGRLIVDEKLIKQIDKYFSSNNSDIDEIDDENSVKSLKLRVQQLEQILEDTQKSLAIANAKDDESKRLLDQQQQLQLESMKRVKELESKLKELPQPKPKESWWRKFFG